MDVSVRGTGAGWPLSLIGMLVLIVAVERHVDRDAFRFMSTLELDWKTAGQAITRAAAKADVLCFGDSMLKFAVSPRVLEDRLGVSAYSFALLDGKPPASFFLFRRAVEGGARPKVVLVDFQPECMAEPPGKLIGKRTWKALVSPRECWELLWTHGDSDFFARTLLGRLLPSMQCRAEVRAEVVASLNGQVRQNPWENAKLHRNRRRNHGGLVLARNPGYTGDVPWLKGNPGTKVDWFSRPENSVYVRRFLRLAGEYKIPVVWILAPNVPKIEEARVRSGEFDRYTKFVRGVQALYANLHVIDGRLSGFDHTVFVDPVHLDREGSTAFSLRVADILRTLLDVPGTKNLWAKIPNYGPARPMVDLEDVEQSGSALAVAGGVVRR